MIALASILCFPILGTTIGFTLFYLIESSTAHHPHAMIGIPAIVFGAPAGAVVGLVAGIVAIRRKASIRVPLFALALAALLVLVFAGWFVGSGRRW